MRFADLVETSAAVSATRSRLAKRDALAALLGRAEPDDIEIVVIYLAGDVRQRRTGIGWASLRELPAAAPEPSLTLALLDAELQRISELSGPGSGAERSAAVRDLFARATTAEQAFLRGLLAGEIRQGALDSVMLDAVAAASGISLTEVRRAVMLRGATGPVAVAALTEHSVAQFALSVGQPVRPMLAASAPDVGAALAKIDGRASVDVKLDGIRIQAHRDGDDVALFTRSLDDITVRLPEVVAVVRALPVRSAILDGEVLALGEGGRPRPFQDTASRTATVGEVGVTLSAFFFDLLAVDGEVLIDEPLRSRLARLDAIVPSPQRIGRLETSDPEAAEKFFDEVVAAGQEGVVIKDLAAPYEAGRRGAGWIKVKPRHTLDLVVLAVERGSGRRQGFLSNIHLGARDPQTGGFVMLGKTFKGMTDEMLAWQTERFTELADGPADGYVVTVRPEQVVEIAFDGLQRSTRYPGGLALRFARVVRYRDDKTAGEADTIETVRGLAG
jgi:DNA ligase-1